MLESRILATSGSGSLKTNKTHTDTPKILKSKVEKDQFSKVRRWYLDFNLVFLDIGQIIFWMDIVILKNWDL